MDIAEFLLARFAEDEEWVMNAGNDFVPVSQPDSSGRLLAEIEAKRAIVDEHEGGGRWCDVCSVELSATEKQADRWPCQTVRLLALPYVTHPDYDPAWAPMVRTFL